MTRDEYRFRLLLAGGVALLILSVYALVTDSAFTGYLFLSMAGFVISAILVMPERDRG